MIKKLFNKLANPLLFYVDKSGNSVFRNYCLLKNDGCAYTETFSIKTAGKALEYRLETDKKLKLTYLLITLCVYFIYIHSEYSIFNFILCELVWLILIFLSRFICAELYRKHLVKTYGIYNITNFIPPISKQKIKNYKRNFISKLILIFIMIFMFFIPAIIMYQGVKMDIKSKKPHYRADIAIAKIYNVFYPKIENFYDITACARYNKKDYNGAIKDYKTIFKISGSKFSKRDFVRFANILYLVKKIYGSQSALDVFNEYYTRKKMSILNESQMLWIKSVFSINNNISEFVIQDYDNLLLSLKDNDLKNKFYITSDKAYMLYLMKNYKEALNLYNELVKYASKEDSKLEKDLPRLYAERGYTKRRLGDKLGADDDFIKSGIDLYEIEQYEPNINKQGFIIDKF